MSKDTIFRFLDDAAEIGVKAISFVSDGESTCSPFFCDAIIRGKNNKLDMALGTNGSLLERDILEKILPYLTYLRINISAADKKRYCEIHGCGEENFDKTISNIRVAVKIKKDMGLETTIGLQMVLMPEFKDQILPLSRLGKELGVDYLVIKHCSDDEIGSLGVDYSKYEGLVGLLEAAERESTDSYLVGVKWSKILSGGKRSYTRCYGPAFIMQFSGSGLVAPCGMFFSNRYSQFHIGNITEKSFKEIWKSDRYWEVLNYLSSKNFNARTMCGKLCLQHKVNEYLDAIKNGKIKLKIPSGSKPMHINFI